RDLRRGGRDPHRGRALVPRPRRAAGDPVVGRHARRGPAVRRHALLAGLQRGERRRRETIEPTRLVTSRHTLNDGPWPGPITLPIWVPAPIGWGLLQSRAMTRCAAMFPISGLLCPPVWMEE